MRRISLLIALLATIIAATQTDESLASQAASRAQPIVYQGYAFDACTAPALSALAAWSASPYRALGIYVGGSNRACGNGNLSASWVASAVGSGWSLLPLYVGLQAPCVGQSGLKTIVAALANVQGTAAASDAVARAASFGLLPGTPIYFDMEAYKTNDPLCSLVVEEFIAAWVDRPPRERLHSRRLWQRRLDDPRRRSAATRGDSGRRLDRELERQAIHLRRPLRVRQPLDLHQRLHQYRGGHRETYAGVTINIDSSIVDAPVAGPGGIGPTTPPPPRRRPAPTPTPTPAPTPAAGTASTPDGIATVDWPANAFSTAATVTLSSATLPKKTQGFAAGSYIAQLKAQSTTGTQIARFAAPTGSPFRAARTGSRPGLLTRRNHVDTPPPLQQHQPPERHRQPLYARHKTARSTSRPSSQACSGSCSTQPAPHGPRSQPGSPVEPCSCAGNPQPTTAPRSPATASPSAASRSSHSPAQRPTPP